MKNQAIGVILLSALLTACSGGPSGTAPTDPYSDIKDYLDANVGSYAKEEIAPLIRLTPNEWRDEMILVDLARGQSISNRSGAAVAKFDQPITPIYASIPSGVAAQASQEPVCTTGAKFRDQYGNPKKGTGVMYRIHTNPGNYDRLKNRVALPREDQIYDFESDRASGSDTAHVYMGGWGDSNLPLEVGLKHNTVSGNWSPYLATQAGRAVLREDFPRRTNGKKYYFDSGSSVFMELVLVGEGTPNQYALFLTTGTYQGARVQYTIGVRLTSSNQLWGWQLPMSQLRFYRATTIAQSNAAAGLEYSENFSFFNGTKWDLGSYGKTLGSTSQPTQVWKSAVGCLVPGNPNRVQVTRPYGNSVEEEIVNLNTNWDAPHSLYPNQTIRVGP